MMMRVISGRAVAFAFDGLGGLGRLDDGGGAAVTTVDLKEMIAEGILLPSDESAENIGRLLLMLLVVELLVAVVAVA